jgi:ATP-dependent DNA helicase RecG
MPEWISEETLSDLKLPSFTRALSAMHGPKTPEDIDPESPAATRLAYDELLANQLALLLTRARMRVIPGRAHIGEGALAQRLETALPFSLTRAQRQAIEDIRRSGTEKRMLRLLQATSVQARRRRLAMAELVNWKAAAMMGPTGSRPPALRAWRRSPRALACASRS